MYNNELQHWGIKGMKWGVRRYQNKDGSLTPEGKHRLKYYTSPNREVLKSIPKNVAHLTLTALVPGYYEISQIKYFTDVHKYKYDGKDYTKKEGSYEKISDLKKKSTLTDISDDLKKSNPRLGRQKGKVNNCTFCTVALEMRARGYDVQARSKGHGAVTEELYSSMFKDFKMQKTNVQPLDKESRKNYVNRSYDNLCNQIEKYGNGSRGYVGITYENANMGHAMYWKVENDRVTFYDGQSGKTNPDKLFALADPSRHKYARLDNLELKEPVTAAVVSRK